ncbi:MAG: hypothetical protein ACYDC8_02495 [Gammaproteobacteria bacterium]
MESAHEKVDVAIREVETFRKNLNKNKAKQVSSLEERNIAKATALSWFNNHLPIIADVVDHEQCEPVTAGYHKLIDFTDRATSRTRYDSVLKALKKDLGNLRKHAVDGKVNSQTAVSSDQHPNFAPLIGDLKMQGILAERWRECVVCILHNAPLAATVMMGGLLETMLLARFNKEIDKSCIFKATTAPKDRKTGKTLELKEWTLRHYLDVAHELEWISRSTRDIGEVVRDFRNYVHPYKQASHGVTLDINDARLFWEISKEITRQLLAKAAP